MIWKIINDINLRKYFPLPLWCFPLGNLNCNDDCLACLGYPTVSHFSTQNWWSENDYESPALTSQTPAYIMVDLGILVIITVIIKKTVFL